MCKQMKKGISMRRCMEVVRLMKLSVLQMASATCLSTMFIQMTGLLPSAETVQHILQLLF